MAPLSAGRTPVRDSLDRRCHESPIEDYAAHYDELYVAWKARKVRWGFKIVTANVIEGEEFETDSDPGDEA